MRAVRADILLSVINERATESDAKCNSVDLSLMIIIDWMVCDQFVVHCLSRPFPDLVWVCVSVRLENAFNLVYMDESHARTDVQVHDTRSYTDHGRRCTTHLSNRYGLSMIGQPRAGSDLFPRMRLVRIEECARSPLDHFGAIVRYVLNTKPGILTDLPHSIYGDWSTFGTKWYKWYIQSFCVRLTHCGFIFHSK